MSRRSCLKTRRRMAYAELRWVDLYVHPDELKNVRSLAAAMMRERYPFLGVRDAYRNVRAGNIIYIVAYPFHVHPDDVEYLREQAELTYVAERKAWGLI